jgi:hypothetical protein
MKKSFRNLLKILFLKNLLAYSINVRVMFVFFTSVVCMYKLVTLVSHIVRQIVEFTSLHSRCRCRSFVSRVRVPWRRQRRRPRSTTRWQATGTAPWNAFWIISSVRGSDRNNLQPPWVHLRERNCFPQGIKHGVATGGDFKVALFNWFPIRSYSGNAGPADPYRLFTEQSVNRWRSKSGPTDYTVPCIALCTSVSYCREYISTVMAKWSCFANYRGLAAK